MNTPMLIVAAPASLAAARLVYSTSVRLMKMSEKSMPPVINPIGGMMISLTSDVTMLPKAAPMITPTARSNALPFTANSLNSLMIFMITIRMGHLHAPSGTGVC